MTNCDIVQSIGLAACGGKAGERGQARRVAASEYFMFTQHVYIRRRVRLSQSLFSYTNSPSHQTTTIGFRSYQRTSYPLSVLSLLSELLNPTTFKPRITPHRTATEYLNHTLFSPMATKRMKLRYYFSLVASFSLRTVLIPVMTFLHDTPSSILDTSTPLFGVQVSTPYSPIGLFSSLP